MAQLSDQAQVLSAGQNAVHGRILPRQADFCAHLIRLADNIKAADLGAALIGFD